MKKLIILMIILGLCLFCSPVFAGNNSVIMEVIKSHVGIVSNSGLGTGIIVTPDGYIVTNKHVVQSGRLIKVYTHDWNVYRGRIVALHPDYDIAIMKIEPLVVLPIIKEVNPRAVFVGEDVFAIGHPVGLAWSVSKGIVSAIRKGENGIIYLQTDASINMGNSGGALINEYGEVIGINTFTYNFVIPGNMGIPVALQGLAFAIWDRNLRSFVEDIINRDILRYEPLTANIPLPGEEEEGEKPTYRGGGY